MATPFPPPGDVSPVGSITPGRQTRAVFDFSQTLQIEEGVNVVRTGREVSVFAGRDNSSYSRFHTGTRQWLSGAWTLAPKQENAFQEAKEQPFLYIPPDNSPFLTRFMAVAVNAVSLAIWKRNGGVGITYNEDVAEHGTDMFYQRQIDATDPLGWGGRSLPIPAPYNALPAALPRQTTGQTCLLHAQEMQRPDQGYCVRFFVPGLGTHVPDTIGIFYFGGTMGGTLPQYALVLRGSGDAQLWEYGRVSAGGAFFWQSRQTMSFAKRGLVSGYDHQLILFPLVGPQGEKFIHFAGLALDTSETSAAGVGSVGDTAGTGGGAAGLSERVYKWSPAVAGTLDGSPGHATGEGRWYLTERMDMRGMWQVGQLAFPTTGTLVDVSIDMPALQSVRPLHYSDTHRIPPAPQGASANPFSLYYSLKRTDTRQPIYQSGGSPPPDGVFVDWTFNSDGTDTPALWGYRIFQPPLNVDEMPGAFTCPLISATITGDEGNAQNESAICNIVDIRDTYPRLRIRGELPFRLQTKCAPIDGNTDPFPVVLFSGIVVRPHGTKRGKPYKPAGMSGPGHAFPKWYDYKISAGGMWMRLQRKTLRTFTTVAHFADDRTAPGSSQVQRAPLAGQIQPWKATDAIRYLLNLGGFPDSQIRIEDNPIRLWQGINSPASDLTVDYNTNAHELIFRIARAYLGLFLHFAPNDGPLGADGLPVGQWILIGPPPKSAPPVWNFVSGPSAANFANGLEGGKAQGSGTPIWSMPGAYADKTTATIGDLEEYPIPPEANAVTFLTAPDELKTRGLKIKGTMVNPYSFRARGFNVVPDPESPHYLGDLRPIVIGDPSIWGGGDVDGLLHTQQAVNFMVRRVFDFACLPRRLKPIYAPLVIIVDPVTNRRRPLRFYDPVTWNGQPGWYVRNVNPEIKRDTAQMAYYELERTIPLGKTS